MTIAVATQVLDQFVQRARQLYTLPAVALEVLELTNQPKVDLRALKNCLAHDPALVTKILRVVNSSLFGLTRPVADLNQALALLGIKPLKMLVLGFSLPKQLEFAVQAEVLGGYWRHALIKAVACREFAAALGTAPEEEAFLVGLLADIGVLVLVQDLQESYLQFYQQVAGDNLLKKERATLGFDHLILGARLLEHWGLPESIIAALDAPRESALLLALPDQERVLPQILQLAELAAQLLTRPQEAVRNRLFSLAQQCCGWSLTEVQDRIAALQPQVEELAQLLAIPLLSGPAYAEIVGTAHSRLAEVAAFATEELGPCEDETELLRATNTLESELRAAMTARGGGAGNSTRSKPEAAHKEVRPAPDRSAVKVVSRGAAPAWTLDPLLVRRTSDAIGACRNRRAAVSLAIAQVDAWPELVAAYGASEADALANSLTAALHHWSQDKGECWHLAEGKFALLWENCDRQEGVGLARHLAASALQWRPAGQDAMGGARSLSIGVATLVLPPKNFPAHELIDAAQRCLGGALLSGGNVVKSLEF